MDDPAIVLLGRETIYRNGKRCGWLSSAGFGFHQGRNIGYGCARPGGVDADYVDAGDYQLEIATELVPADAVPQAALRPAMARIRPEKPPATPLAA